MNNKGADQTARMRRLICTFLLVYGQNRFSDDMAQIEVPTLTTESYCNWPKMNKVVLPYGKVGFPAA